ncbi:MAG: SDR family NAD(P)-dependent oxidoreductase [Chloroflexi bacterium]|nr:SDR family NAD(P)-dependent oxidoreductase [Chloroflexota bacterium]
MEEFRDKVAVITGGASGIGLATAKALAGEGMKLVLADIEQTALDRAVPDVAALGVECIGVKTDVGERPEVIALANTAWSHFGAVHVLFNNAGVAVAGPIAEMKHADWEWLIRVNLWGVIHGIEAFVPRMIAQDQGGHVLSTASFAGLVPNEGLGVYCVTKYGVVALSEVLFRELSPHNIGVSVLCPMRVATNINTSQRNRPIEFGGGHELPAGSGGEEGRSQAGRELQVSDVAPMIVKAIRERQLYILPHEESRGFIQARFRRIDRTFDA